MNTGLIYLIMSGLFTIGAGFSLYQTAISRKDADKHWMRFWCATVQLLTLLSFVSVGLCKIDRIEHQLNQQQQRTTTTQPIEGAK